MDKNLLAIMRHLGVEGTAERLFLCGTYSQTP
jgi:hypothetical protein